MSNDIQDLDSISWNLPATAVWVGSTIFKELGFGGCVVNFDFLYVGCKHHNFPGTQNFYYREKKISEKS